MKSYLLIFCVLLFCPEIKSQTCLPGSITFSTQEEIDNFRSNYPGCTQIIGSITISSSNISNLNGLSGVTLIGGNLNIVLTTNLIDIKGLSAIKSVGGRMTVEFNRDLAYLNGLSSLILVGKNLSITGNTALMSLEGLNSLATVGDYLVISNNRDLTSLKGLEGLKKVENQVGISFNNSLRSLEGLSGLTSIGRFLNISNNPVLEDISALSSLTHIGENMEFHSNRALENLIGLEGLQSIGGGLDLNNNGLKNLIGLQNLSAIGGDLNISDSPDLVDLTALMSLSSINGRLRISNNDTLSSLSGLDNIDHTTIKGLGLILLGSRLLSACSVKSICNYLSIPSNSATISSNAIGCLSRQEIRDSCLKLSVAPITVGEEIKIFPNPAKNSIQVSANNHIQGSYKIINSVGSIFGERKFHFNQPIEIGDLPKGIYFIEIKSNKRTYIRRFIKE